MHLVGASHQRDVEIRRSPSAAQRDRSLDDASLPLQLERLQWTPSHAVAELAPGLGTYEHGSDLRLRLQPCGGVHGVSGRTHLESAPTADGSDHDDPGFDPDPHAEGVDPGVPRDGASVLRSDPLDLQACKHRTLGVILMRIRRTEQGQDAVTRHVFDGSAVSLHDLAGSADGSADDLHARLAAKGV